MKRSLSAYTTLFAAGASVALISGCGSGGSTASGSGSRTSICNQFKTLSNQLNSEGNGATDTKTITSLFTDAENKVKALANQSSDAQLSSDLNSLASALAQGLSSIQSGNSGQQNAASNASDKAIKALGTDCNMNFNTGSSGSSSNSGTSTTSSSGSSSSTSAP